VTAFLLRLPLMLGGGALIARVLDDWTIFILAALSAAFSVLHALLLRVLPEKVDLRRFVLVMASSVLDSLGYVALGLYLWIQPDASMMLLSSVVMAATMLNTVSLRVGDVATMRVEVSCVILGIALRVGWSLFADAAQPGAIAVSAGLVLVSVYYLAAVNHAFLYRAVVVDARETQIEAAKLTAVGRLTGGIAHDFNNMLTAVLGNLELARMTKEPGEQDKLMSEAEQSARRGARLTRELLALSGRAHLEIAPRRPEGLVAAAIATLDLPAGASHSIRAIVAPDLPDVRADATLVVEALAGLLRNACEAMSEGGEVEISVRLTDALDTPTVTFGVRDHGKGIAPDLRPHLFEPYFTTKQVGAGSGLGLPMARGVAEQLQGGIEIQSTPGEGTEVLMHLPAA
jgi:signal transduction histidine kinase